MRLGGQWNAGRGKAMLRWVVGLATYDPDLLYTVFRPARLGGFYGNLPPSFLRQFVGPSFSAFHAAFPADLGKVTLNYRWILFLIIGGHPYDFMGQLIRVFWKFLA